MLRKDTPQFGQFITRSFLARAKPATQENSNNTRARRARTTAQDPTRTVRNQRGRRQVFAILRKSRSARPLEQWFGCLGCYPESCPNVQVAFSKTIFLKAPDPRPRANSRMPRFGFPFRQPLEKRGPAPTRNSPFYARRPATTGCPSPFPIAIEALGLK